MSEGFTEFWACFPRRIAKKSAEKAYLKARKEYSHAAIMASLRIFLETEWRGRPSDKIPHAATWLNRESFEERTEALFDDDERPMGRHLCRECGIEHEWQESGPAYNWIQQWLLACPQAHAEMKAAIGKTS